jgi:hypothetical protein
VTRRNGRRHGVLDDGMKPCTPTMNNNDDDDDDDDDDSCTPCFPQALFPSFRIDSNKKTRKIEVYRGIVLEILFILFNLMLFSLLLLWLLLLQFPLGCNVNGERQQHVHMATNVVVVD